MKQMEEKKRKVVTYHSTISNDKLERELNEGEGYHIESCQQLRSYLVMVLVKDEKHEVSYPFETKVEDIEDFVKVDLKDEDYEKQKNELFKKGFKIRQLTTQRALFIKEKNK
jgi:hypothetical protein